MSSQSICVNVRATSLKSFTAGGVESIFSPTHPAAPRRGFHQAPAAFCAFSPLFLFARMARLASNVRA
jgi:hypothetical protein